MHIHLVKSVIFLIVYLSFAKSTQAQDDLKICFNPILNQKPLILKNLYEGKSDLQITTLKCYFSQFIFYENDKQIWQSNEIFHLFDYENEQSQCLNLPIPDSIKWDELHFLLGIDSLTNVSGVFGGDLDPSNGMYWAWNSGYINFKLEGKSSSCPNKSKEFQFHLGGYADPYQSSQLMKFNVSKSAQLNLAIHLDTFFKDLDLKTTHHIMSPSKTAQELSRKASEMFQIQYQ